MLLEEFTKDQERHNRIIVEVISSVKASTDKVQQLEEKVVNRQPVINLSIDIIISPHLYLLLCHNIIFLTGAYFL